MVDLSNQCMERGGDFMLITPDHDLKAPFAGSQKEGESFLINEYG